MISLPAVGFETQRAPRSQDIYSYTARYFKPPPESSTLETAPALSRPARSRAQFDPGSIWLRNLMLETGRGLDRRKRRAA
jgi:hypothetical protein